jgi:hypothetical protein
MVLELVRDAYQALIGSRQEQRADGRIHGPVRDIEQPIDIRRCRESITEASHCVGFVMGD